MGQNDGAIVSRIQNPPGHNRRSRATPVIRVHRPHDCRVTEARKNHTALPLIQRPVWRSHRSGLHSGGPDNSILGFSHLTLYLGIAQSGQPGVRVGVVSDFVTFRHDPPRDSRVTINILTNDIKSGLDVTSAKNVEQSRRVARVRTIIKSHRDIGLSGKPPGMGHRCSTKLRRKIHIGVAKPFVHVGRLAILGVASRPTKAFRNHFLLPLL